MDAMTIGQASERSGIPPKTIRYYESVGLISRATRGQNNYRGYGDNDVEVLRFIGRARGLGFSLNDIELLLALYRDHDRSSREVKRLALQHISDLDRKLTELNTIKRALLHLVERCLGDGRPDCPILDALGPRALPRSSGPEIKKRSPR